MNQYRQEQTGTYSSEIIEFTTIAAEVMRLLEQAETHSLYSFCNKALNLLPLLYIKARLLHPQLPIAIDEEEEDLPTIIDETAYEEVRTGISRLFGEEDIFLSTEEEEMKYSERPVAHAISEYLADVYQPIGDFLFRMRDGLPQLAPLAARLCVNDMQTYWGSHLLEAVVAMNRLSARLIEEELNEEEEDNEIF